MNDSRLATATSNSLETVGLSQNNISLPVYIAAYMFEVFLYGMHTILFTTCLFILLKNKSPFKWPLLLSAITMFSLSTASVVVTIYLLFGILIPGKISPDAAHPKYIFYVVNSMIADSLMISRCYAAWCKSKRVIMVPCLLLLASSLSGLIFTIAPAGNLALRGKLYIYLWLSLSLNLLVTFLTAIRIWWMARQTSRILGPAIARKYYSAVAIIIESGAIFSLYILMDQVAGTFILDSGLTQVVGMVPALIIVQVGLGRHTKDIETTVSIVRGETHTLPTPQPDEFAP
ncbi:hypothetical protein P691DRAFT_757805 [Macrolepiota fuliginosa MF-IS2]|uniref:Uncharacterized protein n=1 Tax=Macrolepiota fuliginosa MF-IS2 TaxID=1400762 RepID=A0A9P5XG76_9AGAR|nr:hypothetical protein P691DRAFT_757805 [Macrolepiota fuliginosa MF-IS2]